jgi:hypothetical protein
MNVVPNERSNDMTTNDTTMERIEEEPTLAEFQQALDELVEEGSSNETARGTAGRFTGSPPPGATNLRRSTPNLSCVQSPTKTRPCWTPSATKN